MRHFYLSFICLSCFFGGVKNCDIESLPFFLLCDCACRRPRSDTQGVCDEADGPVSEARRDVSRQAPLTHICACPHTHAPIGTTNMLCIHIDSTHAKTKAEAQGCDCTCGLRLHKYSNWLLLSSTFFTKPKHTKMQQIAGSSLYNFFLLITEGICTLHKMWFC